MTGLARSACIAIALAVLTSATVVAQLPELRAFRERGDWIGLERLCRERLAANNLKLEERAEWTAELAGSLAQQANLSTSQRSSEQWAEADRLLAEFLRDQPRNPRSLHLLRQRMLYAHAHGEQLRRLAAGDSDSQLAESKKLLRQAETLALELEQSIQQQLDAYTTRKAGVTPFEQLVALSNDAPLRLAQIRLSLARVLPEHSADRGQKLEEAIKGFEFYLRDGLRDGDLSFRAGIGSAQAHVLLGRYDRATELLKSLENLKHLSAKQQDEVLALRMDVCLGQRQPRAALTLLRSRAGLSPELALRQVHAHFLVSQQARDSGDEATAAGAQNQGLRAMEVGRSEFGPAWTLQATRVLGELASPLHEPENPAGWELLAAGFEQVQRWPEAAIALERLVALAVKNGDATARFKLTGRLGYALIQAGRPEEALAAYQSIARDSLDPAQSEQASLWAMHAARRCWEKDRSEPHRGRLENLAQAHLARFREHSSSGDAHYVLALVANAKSDLLQAIQHYRSVPLEHRLAPSAAQSALRLAVLALGSVPREQRPALFQQARDYLALLESTWRTKEPTWMQAELKLCRGRLMLHEELTQKNLLQAQAILEQVVTDELTLPGQRDLASESLVLVLAARGETRAALARLPSDSAKDGLLRLRDDLVQLQSRVENDCQPAMIEVRLAVVQALARQAPSPNLRREAAQLLVKLGRAEQARPLLAELDQQLAQDAAFTLEHAQALQAMGTRADYQRATELYRRLERLTRPGSDGWLEARYQLAACLAELGEKERARSILRVTAKAWLDQDADGIESECRQKHAGRFQELEGRLAR